LTGVVPAVAVELQPVPLEQQFALSLQTDFSLANAATLGPDDSWTDDVDKPAQKNDQPDQPSTGRKSIARAAALSALLPGAGLHYLGERRKARYFFAAEALTWLGYISFKIYGNWKEDDYIRFANSHANAQLGDKGREFHDLVGFYPSIDDYNTFGRIFDPERPYLQDTPANHWRWQSLEDRETYRHLKNRSREADRRADFMLGVAVLDRIVAVIDAIRSGRQHNKRVEQDTFSQVERPYLKLKISPFSNIQQVKLTFYADFY
jgi:hypothetical protein